MTDFTIGHDARRDRGFMMVALLIGMAVTAIWMTAALPSWRHQAQRIREEELIFRGEQYARAIVLFQNKNRGAYPPDIEVLVSQHYLRKKWKDPVTGCDFLLLGMGIIADPGKCPKYTSITKPTAAPTAPLPTGGQMGITGVRSQSQATSIKVYQGQQQHSQWPFDANRMRQQMGGPAGANPQGGRQPPTDGRGGGRQGGDAVAPGRGVPLPGRGGGGPGGPGTAPVPPRPIGRGGGGLF